MAILPLVITALTWLGRIGLAVFAVNEIQAFLNKEKVYLGQSTQAAEDAGFSKTEQKKIIAATTYEKIEEQGKNPEDFWNGLNPQERSALEFSPQSLQADIGRTKFLGISSALLFASSLLAGGIAGVRGIPVLLKTLAKLGERRKAGAGALELLTIIEEGKIAGIAKVWVPGLIGTLAAAGGWLTSTMTNNLNDATLWGRIFLGQAFDDLQKAGQKRLSGPAAAGGDLSQVPHQITRIRMSEEKKPTQFIGTLFSAKLGSADSFERHVDDMITDLDDLREDVKLNLNRWLASLPSRMGYSVVIRKDPVDEMGVQQSGIWATLTLLITHISGKTTPIDTILLGPVEPQVRLELQKQTKTIETEIKDFLKASTVREITVPSGSVDIFTPSGERIDLATVAQAEAIAAPVAAAAAATPSQPPPEPVKITTEKRFIVPIPGAGSKEVPESEARAALNQWENFLATGNFSFFGKDTKLAIAETKQALGIPPGPGTPILDAETIGASIVPRLITVSVANLFVRSGPTTTSPLAGSQSLTRGQTFKAVAWVGGETVDGERRWWKSEFGNYVWSGGTAEKPF